MAMNGIENLDTLGPIVMVDDSEMDLDICRRFYEYSKLENPFLGLRSGIELLSYLEEVRAGNAVYPALVLLDINMPKLNGFDTLERVRAQGDFREVPIIVMLTNSDNPKDVEKALQLGANGYEAKHFEVDAFVAFLKKSIA